MIEIDARRSAALTNARRARRRFRRFVSGEVAGEANAATTEDFLDFPSGTTSINFTGYATKGSMFEALANFQITKIHAAIGSPGDAYEALVAVISGFGTADTITSILSRETGLTAIDGIVEIPLTAPADITAGTKFAVALTRTDGGPGGFLNLKKTNGVYQSRSYVDVTASNPGFYLGDDSITGGEAISNISSTPYKITFTAVY